MESNRKLIVDYFPTAAHRVVFYSFLERLTGIRLRVFSFFPPADSAGRLHRSKAVPPRIGAGVREAAALLRGVRRRPRSGLRRRLCDAHPGLARGGQPGPEGQLRLDLAVHKEEKSGSPVLKDGAALTGQCGALGNISCRNVFKKKKKKKCPSDHNTTCAFWTKLHELVAVSFFFFFLP